MMMQQELDDALKAVFQAYGSEQWQTVCRICEALTEQGVQRPDVHTAHGIALCRLGQTADAEAAYLAAIDCGAGYIDAYRSLGNLLRQQGRLREAAHYYRVAIGKAPQRLDLWIALSDVLNALQEYTQSIHVCRYAIALDANQPDAYNNLGNAYSGMGEQARALQCYVQARQTPGGCQAAMYNQALMLERLQRVDEAVRVLRELIAQNPEHLNAHIKLGDLSKQTGHTQDAMAIYRRVLELNPAQSEVHNNLGNLYAQQSQWPEALHCYRRALECGSPSPLLYQNLGNAYHALRQYEPAIDAYRKGLALAAEDVSLLAQLVHVQQKLCDWQDLEHLRERLLLPTLAYQGDGLPPPPFNFLGAPMDISPAEHQEIARRYARGLQDAIKQRFSHPRATHGDKRLRIGYVSADFHNHATAHLMLGLFRRHDRAKVEIVGYSLGPDDGSRYRQRIQADCDRFFDLRPYSDVDAAGKIHQDGIDILVDLKGYTGDARPGIFVCRPAPIQVAYLGYPGTLGADFIDYVLADKTVLPPEQIPYYTEKPAYLPHCYQVNDIDQPIADAPSRSACGLPEQGFVFCCFNAAFKIEPQVFALWMQLLQAVPGSVLWMLGQQATMVGHLRQQAMRHGVVPERLVFAGHLPKDQHLARVQLADLFLDTYYYNAHTTSSDALWAGVPVITRSGEYFPSRVAASLLKAIGLEELIVTDTQAYVDLALRIAHQPAYLQQLRDQLRKNRMTWPLFDTKRFARALEDLYQTMWQRWANGLPPAVIEVSDAV